MTKRNIMLMLALLLVPVMLMSIEYNLNNYQVSDYFEHDLKLNLGSNTYVTDEDFSDRLQSTNSLNVEYSAERYSRKNILKYQGKFGFGYYQWDNSRKDSTGYESTSSTWDGSFALSTGLRRYILSDWFCNLEIVASGYQSTRDSDSDYYVGNSNERETETDQEAYSESGSLGFGYGRIENVTKACKALNILTELESAGLLQRQLSKDDVEELAGLLIELESLHLFDYRLQRMEEIRQLVRVLEGMDLLASTDIESFLILLDLNAIDNAFQRESGWEIYPEFRIENYDGRTDSDRIITTEPDSTESADIRETVNESNKICYQANLHLKYSWVFDLNWQLEAQGSYGYFWEEREEDESEINYSNEAVEDSIMSNNSEDIEGYTLNFDINLSWYPNTRTRFWLGFNYEMQDSDNDYDQEYASNIEDDEDESFELTYDYFKRNYSITAGMGYYFSPRLYLSLGMSYSDMNLNSELSSLSRYYSEERNKFSCYLRVYYYLF